MKLSIFIKPILALSVSLLASTTLASVYSSYLPIVDAKNLSVIMTITILLGFVAFYQKRH
ncbi:hypothetical protein [Candidatus Thioglobus sp.]|uniref:hypothetical protein n=1 Tax=Candidatus Thioglobus sp. TaxID=2026721 RepID=UPI003D0B111A